MGVTTMDNKKFNNHILFITIIPIKVNIGIYDKMGEKIYYQYLFIKTL